MTIWDQVDVDCPNPAQFWFLLLPFMLNLLTEKKERVERFLDRFAPGDGRFARIVKLLIIGCPECIFVYFPSFCAASLYLTNALFTLAGARQLVLRSIVRWGLG